MHFERVIRLGNESAALPRPRTAESITAMVNAAMNTPTTMFGSHARSDFVSSQAPMPAAPMHVSKNAIHQVTSPDASAKSTYRSRDRRQKEGPALLFARLGCGCGQMALDAAVRHQPDQCHDDIHGEAEPAISESQAD